MFWMMLFGAFLILMGLYGCYIDRKVDRKYQRVARKKSVVRWDDDKAA